MFAPEGYISLDELVGILDTIAMEWRFATPHPNDPKPGGSFVDNSFHFIDDKRVRGDAYREWLFQCFLNRHENNLFACTESGRALKLSRSVVLRLRVFDGPFIDMPEHWIVMTKHLEDIFLNISTDGYKIDIEKAERFSRGGLINPTLAKLDQLPVCWPLPKPIDKLDWNVVCGVSTDNEKNRFDMSPQSISKRILLEKRRNPALSREEIKEIVAPTVSHGQFRLGWTLASQENPSISKPGRKS